MSWLSELFGTNKLSQNFNYDPAQSNVSGGNQWTYQGMTGLGTSGQNLLDISGSAMDQSEQFLDPNSQYYQQRRGFMREDLSSGIDTMNRNINQQLSSRGMGGGGIKDMLSAVNRSQIGEDVRRGSSEMYEKGIGFGQQFMNTGIGAGTGATTAYGQLGQQGGNMQNRLMQQAMFNAGQTNEASQYERTSSYNQAAGNRAAQGAFMGNLMNLGTSLVTGGFGGFGGGGGAGGGGSQSWGVQYPWQK